MLFRRALGGSVVIGLGFIGLTVAVSARLVPLVRFDVAASAVAHQFALDHALWLATMRMVTRGGDPVLAKVVLVCIMWVLFSLKERELLRFVVVTVVVTTGLRWVIRAVLARSRPIDGLVFAPEWAYPSGHTSDSALIAVAVLAVGTAVLASRGQRACLTVVAVGFAGSVGASRVALVVHWPSDVLGGWMLVSAVALAALPLLETQKAHGAMARQRTSSRTR